MEDTNSLTEPGKTGAALNMFHEREAVFFLVLLAAVHVFVFSAAFPFFTNIDEPIHFDLVVKYSHGHVPRKLETLSAGSAVYLSLFSSCAYLGTPEMFLDGKFPEPPWKESPEKMHRDLTVNLAAWERQENYEVSQPPLYYALAGLWWRIGHRCGLRGGRLLYWLRFLNILVVGALVWIGYRAARMVFPENRFLRLGVPTVLAFMPQSAFYSIENDVLSPLCFGVLFICIVRWMRTDAPNVRLGMTTGLAFAATFLTKLTNLPLLGAAAAVILIKVWKLLNAGKMRATWPVFAGLILCAGLPAGAWLAWCKYNFGDFTGSELKIKHLGWTLKPFSEWWHHPIFTPHGFWTFISGLLATFWQGEFWWHDHPMTSPAINMIYVLSSICACLVAVIALVPTTTETLKPERQTLWFAFWSFIASVLFFGFLSIIYNFHNCPNPSQDHPYFTSGRLLLGALIPFLLLFVFGFDRALKRFSERVKFGVMGVWILFMLGTEIATDWTVFSSQYNWFHL